MQIKTNFTGALVAHSVLIFFSNVDSSNVFSFLFLLCVCVSLRIVLLSGVKKRGEEKKQHPIFSLLVFYIRNMQARIYRDFN